MPTLHEHYSLVVLISPYADTQVCGRFTSSIIDDCRMEKKKPSLSDLVVELHDGDPIDRCAVRQRPPV
jgi:hypothetical protein